MGRPKRNVLAAADDTLSPPTALSPNQSVVRVIKPEGNNLYSCEFPDKKIRFLELAQRFRNTIWIRRGGFVLAERYDGQSEEVRAEGEIVNVVRNEKQWRKQPYWYVPVVVAAAAAAAAAGEATTIIDVHLYQSDLDPRPKEFPEASDSDSEEESTVGKMPPSDSESN
jgi:probable RNA-binding protein EIF1AD